MMALLFLLFGLTMLAVWFGKRRPALGLFAVSLLLSIAWFKYHVTEPLNLSF